MDLTELIPRTSGRARREIDYEVIGDLSEADIALLETERSIQPIDPIKLRDSHHSLARALAAGKRPAEAAIITGYSSSRISILQRSPAFQELVEFYRGSQAESALVDFRERIRNFSMDMLVAISEEMEDFPERYSPGMKAELFKLTADRGGLGPESRTVSTSVHVDIAGRMERGLERVRNAKIIDNEDAA